MKAVILAAGEGRRIEPLTLTRPKHLLKIGDKTLLEHCLNAVKTAGVDEVLLVIHHMGEKIRQHFGGGETFGVKIEYVEQQAVLGTGNAVKIVEPYITNDFLVVYGDLWFAPSILERVIKVHREKKPGVTMTVVPITTPEEYGIVELGKDTHVTKIIEKPQRMRAPSNLANAGIYIFSTKIFDKIEETRTSVRGESEITDAISLSLIEKDVISLKISADEWVDVGRPWDVLEANCRALRRTQHKVSGQIEDGAHLIGPVNVAEKTRVRSGAYVEGPVFIDDESDVGPNCYIRPYTTVGRNVRVGNACEIKNSIIMDNTHIGHLSYVGDSVIGENCNLGAGTITANYRFDSKSIKMVIKNRVMNSGRTKLGAVLGDNSKTGINVLLMPGVKVGNNSWIGPNVVVSRDVPPNTTVFLKQGFVEKRQKLQK